MRHFATFRVRTNMQSTGASVSTLQEAAQLLMRAADCLTSSSSCDAQNGDVGGGRPDRQEHARGSQQSGPSCSGHGQTQASTSRPWGLSQNTFIRTMPYPYRPHPRRQQSRALVAPKSSMWKHCFVCLGRVGQTMVPDASERIHLLQAGLGEKKLCVDVKM